jgi:hypothetical protein
MPEHSALVLVDLTNTNMTQASNKLPKFAVKPLTSDMGI